MRARTDRIVVALSGPVGSGKTTVANALQRAIGAQLISTRGLLRDRALSDERRTLQELGEELDQRAGGWWVAEPALKASVASQRPVIVDAVRTAEQLAAIRTGAQLVHLHLTAPEAVLEQRYAERRARRADTELASYADVRASPTEAAVDGLAPVADVVIDTSQAAVSETCQLAVEQVKSVLG